MRNVPVVLRTMIAKSPNKKVAGEYSPSGILKYLNQSFIDYEKIAGFFKTVQEELGATVFSSSTCTTKMSIVAAPTIGNMKFNLDASTQAMIKIIDEAGLRENGKKFVESISTEAVED